MKKAVANQSLKFIVSGIAMAAALAQSGVAMAQDATESADDEIVVTGSRVRGEAHRLGRPSPHWAAPKLNPLALSPSTVW